MSEIQFEDAYQPTRPAIDTPTGLTKFFIEHSFGMIKDKNQAIVGQIIVCVIVFIVIAFMLSGSEENTISQPTQDLIWSRQPIGPIN